LRIFGAAQKILYDVGGIIMKLWNEWVFPVIQHLQGAFAELWANHLKPLWDEVLKVATSIGDAVIALWNNPLKPIVNWIVNLLGPPIVNVCHQIINVFKTVIAGISDGIKAGLKALRGLLDFITGVFSGDWKKAWNGIKTYFSGIWDGLVNVVRVPVNLIIDLVEGMANGVISALNGMIRAINGQKVWRFLAMILSNSSTDIRPRSRSFLVICSARI
jgi:phage-related protein